MRFLLRSLLPTGVEGNSVLPTQVCRDNVQSSKLNQKNLMAKQEAEQQPRDQHIQIQNKREENKLLRRQEELRLQLQQQEDEVRLQQHERELENERESRGSRRTKTSKTD